jgi:hypothetical protein
MGNLRFWFAFISILMAATTASAQWQYGGEIIGQRNAETDPLAVAYIGNGNTIVAWNGYSGPSLDIKAQLVDSAGFTPWGQSGLIVYRDDSVTQKYPAVLPDGNGGAFVVWTDWRHTPSACLYGQHLDSLGNLLWPSEGVRLTYDDSTSQRVPSLFSDGYGGFVAIYNVTPFIWARTLRIGSQRVDEYGNILWGSTGIALTGDLAQPHDFKACKVSDTTFAVIWVEDRFDSNPDSSFYGTDIYMQRFDIHGNIFWGPDGLPAVHYRYDQGYLWDGHDLVSDGEGG